MANYDGPLFSITTGVWSVNPTTLDIPYWTEAPEWTLSNIGTGSGSGGENVYYPNGYGYGHSG